MLNQLDESIGHRLIPLQDGNYTWNPDVEFDFDVDEFDRLVREGESAADDEERLEFCLKAAELYQGDFLPVFATEPWVIPVSTYYHNLYLHAVLNALPILEKSNRLKEAVVLCKKAVKISPYHEGIYQHLMQNLLNLGEQKEVIKVYNDMRQLLFGSFGIMPSDELRSIYSEALYTVNHQILSIDQVFAQLKEEETPCGALICDYDFFKTLYHAEARSAARNGELVHLCLLTMKEKKEKELTSRTLDRCMRNLQTVIHDSLRKQDIAARCSESQFVVLLPRIQYRNALLVCDRLQREYARQYPHSPGEITFAVNPPKKI